VRQGASGEKKGVGMERGGTGAVTEATADGRRFVLAGLLERRLAWYTTGASHSWSGPRCAHCDGPFFADDPLVIQDDVRWHLACPPAW
jgi:hypothetical protein